MLLPALSKARAKARSISCINNLKQVGLGCALYADSFDDYYPQYYGPDEAGVAHYTWPTFLASVQMAPTFCVCPSWNTIQDDETAKDIGRRAMPTYDNVADAIWQWVMYGWNPDLRRNSAVSINGVTWQKLSGRQIDAKNPSSLLVLTETFCASTRRRGWWQVSRSFADTGYTGDVDIRHEGAANVLYGDFHVDARKTQIISDKETADSNNNAYLSPLFVQNKNAKLWWLVATNDID